MSVIDIFSSSGEKLHVEGRPRRVRVLFAGEFIVDTKNSYLVWEKPNYPTYFFDQPDLPEKYLQKSGSPFVEHGAKAERFNLIIGELGVKNAVVKYTQDGEKKSPVAGMVKIFFGAPEAWFEEEEQIFVHPKDPYKRVEVLQSSRHVRVELNGVELANTTKPRLLFETGLRTRTYIPKTDCRLELLRSSDQTSQCPYKGIASYYDIVIPGSSGRKERESGLAWWYRTPLPECGEIRGFVAFYDEFVDVWVDGEKQTTNTSKYP